MRYKGCVIIIGSFSDNTTAFLVAGQEATGFLPEPKSLPNDHKVNKRVVHFSDLLVFYKANAAKKCLIKQPYSPRS